MQLYKFQEVILNHQSNLVDIDRRIQLLEAEALRVNSIVNSIITCDKCNCLVFKQDTFSTKKVHGLDIWQYLCKKCKD